MDDQTHQLTDGLVSRRPARCGQHRRNTFHSVQALTHHIQRIHDVQIHSRFFETLDDARHLRADGAGSLSPVFGRPWWSPARSGCIAEERQSFGPAEKRGNPINGEGLLRALSFSARPSA